MSSQPVTKDRPGQTSTFPRAIIHKQILDAADSSPNASIAEIAEQVSGATKSLVERVFDEYGDPAAEVGATDSTEPSVQGAIQTPTHDDIKEESGEQTEHEEIDEDQTADESVPSYDELSNRQQEIVEAIYEHPEATQRELASTLGITGATVSVHANSIPGLNWAHRKQAVTKILKKDNFQQIAMQKPHSGDLASPNTSDLPDRVERLEQRLKSKQHSPPVEAPLAHKVIHACMESERITEDEELEIIASLLGN